MINQKTTKGISIIILSLLIISLCLFSSNPVYVYASNSISPPAFPHVARASSTALKLTWSKDPAVTGYEIYRATGDSTKFIKVKTIANSSTVTWVNTKLKTDQKYTYKLRSYVTTGSVKNCSGYTYTISAVPYSKTSRIVNAAKNLSGSTIMDIGVMQTLKLGAKVFPSKYGTAKKKKVVDPTIRVIATSPIAAAMGKGSIKGISPGETVVYALAHNGNVMRIKVNVVDYARPATWDNLDKVSSIIQGILVNQKQDLTDVFSYLATHNTGGMVSLDENGLLVNMGLDIAGIEPQLYRLLNNPYCGISITVFDEGVYLNLIMDYVESALIYNYQRDLTKNEVEEIYTKVANHWATYFINYNI